MHLDNDRQHFLVFPSSLIVPSFHSILFFAFNSSKAIITIHYTYIQISSTYVVQSTDILYPAIIGEDQLPTPLCETLGIKNSLRVPILHISSAKTLIHSGAFAEHDPRRKPGDRAKPPCIHIYFRMQTAYT